MTRLAGVTCAQSASPGAQSSSAGSNLDYYQAASSQPCSDEERKEEGKKSSFPTEGAELILST